MGEIMQIINNSFKTIILLMVTSLLFSCAKDNPAEARAEAVSKLYDKGIARIAIANTFKNNPSNGYDALLLAQEKINKENIAGVQIELVKYDDGGTHSSSKQTAYTIASDQEICSIIGHGYSHFSIPVSFIYQYYGILMFNHLSTDDRLTDKNNVLLFRNIPTNSQLGIRATELCNKNNFQNVIIYYEETPTSENLANSFELDSTNKYVNIVTRDSFSSTTTEIEHDRAFKFWKNNFTYDAIFLSGSMPTVLDVVKRIRSSGITCPIIGDDNFDNPIFYNDLPTKENGRIYAISNFNPNNQWPPYQEFVQDFIDAYGEVPDQEAVQYYDALMVLAKAIKLANSAEPAKIAQVLNEQEWQEVAGPYTFNEDGDIQGRNLTVKVLENGNLIPVQ